jgi:hypothetical protein
MTSALLTMQSGESAMTQAASLAASGNPDNIEDASVAMIKAQTTHRIGVKLAEIADDMMKSTIDMLA